MNEKIKALLVQAKTQVEHGEGCYPATTVRYDALEKFAELIVKECAHVALMSNGNNLHVCDLIKKHFGVRE